MSIPCQDKWQGAPGAKSHPVCLKCSITDKHLWHQSQWIMLTVPNVSVFHLREQACFVGGCPLWKKDFCHLLKHCWQEMVFSCDIWVASSSGCGHRPGIWIILWGHFQTGWKNGWKRCLQMICQAVCTGRKVLETALLTICLHFTQWKKGKEIQVALRLSLHEIMW